MSNGLFEVMSEISQVPTKHLAFVVVKKQKFTQVNLKKKKDLLYNYKWTITTRLLGTKADFALISIQGLHILVRLHHSDLVASLLDYS